MEDSFRFRVDRVFGSLGNTPLASLEGVNPSLWSLTGQEIEKHEWNRNKVIEDEDDVEEDEDDSGSAVVQSPFLSDLQDLSDYEEEEVEIDGKTKKRCPPVRIADAIADEHWDIQANIGLDCTLDYEEEEDQYDKVAVGMEECGDRLYMKDIKYTDYCVDDLNSHCELLDSFQVVRDPRANHMAAKIRLKEDAEATPPLLSETCVLPNGEAEEVRKGEIECNNPKPILKKRGNQMDSRSHKRVRFKVDSESFTQNIAEEQVSGSSNSTFLNNDRVKAEYASDQFKHSPGIPDYLRNPSKYTRYSFDTSETMDDLSNQKACLDFLRQLREQNSASSSSSDDKSVDVPLSVTFIPRKKQDDDSMVGKSEFKQRSEDHDRNKILSVSIAAVDDQEFQESAMEEDEPCPKPANNHLEKPGRHYRTRTTIDLEETLT